MKTKEEENYILINRQKAEIEKLKKENKILSHNADNAFQEGLNECRKRFESEIKAEAYKEMAKRIQQEIGKAYDNNIKVLNEHFTKHKGCGNDYLTGIITGKNNALSGLSYFIDDFMGRNKNA